MTPVLSTQTCWPGRTPTGPRHAVAGAVVSIVLAAAVLANLLLRS